MFGKKEIKEDNKFKNDLLNKNEQKINNEENNSNDSDEISQEVQVEETQNNKLEEENKKLKENLMRTLAELDNTRKRAIEENEKTAKYAISKFSEDLISIMENFYLAFESIKEANLDVNKDLKNFVEGIKLTQNELKKAFERNGLVRIFPLKENFNPDLHNAISQIESDEEEGVIVEVMQAGYIIKDRLLRPALVAVSKEKN